MSIGDSEVGILRLQVKLEFGYWGSCDPRRDIGAPRAPMVRVSQEWEVQKKAIRPLGETHPPGVLRKTANSPAIPRLCHHQFSEQVS